ncbi:methyl-accepting chemotaxis sensory transducer [Thalassoporum mexicanum PCC 7367]|uniref:methyl-accepting chemotaxis protein n=1 Tax=Thalassoporum mexicanum TaxID=3457544 RepID=UPI00029FEB68|nr:HAMP domain-containing methyl-accepting chemotaxis protein [Pseudanabaena sp. PCC 7367]AFY70398.1 methyl-accepting chemotaxis sensory transducer [Pseudanabaena sp. PCC 7367]
MNQKSNPDRPLSRLETDANQNGHQKNGHESGVAVPAMPTNNGAAVDLMPSILEAYELESRGGLEAAIAIYQQVIEQDPDGTYGAIAKKALENLQPMVEALAPSAPPELAEPELDTTGKPVSSPTKKAEIRSIPKLKQKSLIPSWFLNLPVGRKQLSTLIASEVLSLGIIAFGAVLIGQSLKQQLFEQASSEVAVMDINYNIKINQMGFGFRGQSDNLAIVAAANSYASSNSISAAQEAQVKGILENEITARTIEYATLVGTDRRIIVNANADRTGQSFDPAGLVSAVLENPAQIKASAIVPAADLQAEAPPLPPGFAIQDALIRYTATPVFAPGSSSKVVGVLISGDIVNNKQPIAQLTLSALGQEAEAAQADSEHSGYAAVYMRQPSGEFVLATSLLQTDQGALQPNIGLNPTPQTEQFLNEAAAAEGEVINARLKIGDQYFTLAAQAEPSQILVTPDGAVRQYNDQPTAILVRGTSEFKVTNLTRNTWLSLGISTIIVLILDIMLALILRESVAKPIQELTPVTQAFAGGNRKARAEIVADDEVGELAVAFNNMADSIVQSEKALERQAKLNEQEAKAQKEQKERLQREVISLLLEIEGAQKGDLTVQAKITEGEVGSIADAFNATIRKLKTLVVQVKNAAIQVNELVQSTGNTVDTFSDSAQTQSKVIANALFDADESNKAIQRVAKSAQNAAKIANQGVLAAQEGDTKIDQTVQTIEGVRSSVAATSKKVKRLAESSQEISQIVSIISGISEKTNLLAFNASIEAARAGEHGQGFRVVADEVRRLADRVTEATREIHQLVGNIQQETTEVLQTMEASTTEVVAGTKLVNETKETLKGLAEISRNIDAYLQSISDSTVSQTLASEQVNKVLENVNEIAKSTEQETKSVTTSLQDLVGVLENLQVSVDQFRLEKE